MTETTGNGELDDVMETTEGASRDRHEHGGYSARPNDDLLDAMKGHVVGWGELVGTYQRE